MDQKCAHCGADAAWDEEKQKFYCSESCWKGKNAPDSGVSPAFSKHYRILFRTVMKLRREVAALKAINKEAFDTYLNALADAAGATTHPSADKIDGEDSGDGARD